MIDIQSATVKKADWRDQEMAYIGGREPGTTG
jgi:hypothetical protein